MRIYFLGLFFLTGIAAFAQDCTFTLSGKTIDFHTQQPLAGATIIVAGTGKSVLTDLDGTFSIKSLCKQTYRLQVSHPECLTKLVLVRVNGDTFKKITLEHHISKLEKVVLKGKSQGNSLESTLESRVGGKNLARQSASSLADVLNEISGVSSLSTGNAISKPMIHGLYGSRVVILNHGTRLQGQDWGAEHAPAVDINTAGSISVIKGAAALQFSGDAIGGIVKIVPEQIPRKDSLYGNTRFTAASNGRGTSLASRLTKSYKNGWFASLQGTLKRFGDFEAPDYMLSNTGFSEKDVSIRIGLDRYTHGFEAYYSYFHNELGILAASHLGGIQDQIRAIESERPLIVRDFTYAIDAPKQEVSHHLAKLKFFKRFENFGKLSVQYDFQQNHRLEFDRRRNSSENSRPAIDLTLTTHSLKSDLEIEKWNDFDLKAGISGRYQTNFSDPDTGVKRLIPDYDEYRFGAYALAIWEINNRLVAEAGARYDFSRIDAFKYYLQNTWQNRGYDKLFREFEVGQTGNQILTHPVFDFHAISATAGIRYDFGNKFDWVANYSLAERVPNPSELFSEGLHHSASRIEIGDLRFGKETAHKVSIGLRKNSGDFQFTVHPYANFIQNFVLLEPVEIRQTIRGSFQVWEYRQTDVRLLGVDFDARLKLSEKFSTHHSFSMVKGMDLGQNEPLINMPPVQTVNKVRFKNPEWSGLELELESKFVFRQNEYPDNRFEVFVPISQTTETVDLSTPPEAYHLLNFSAGIDISKTRNHQFRLGLSINNLLNNSYRDYLNRQRYYADNLGRNILLRLNLNF